MKRLFVATPIVLNEIFISIFEKLKNNTKFDSISWIEKENLHLTIRFIGKTPNDKIELLNNELVNIFKHQHEIKLVMNKIGIFGSRYKPTIIWLGFEENQEMKILYDKIKTRFQEIGVETQSENFVPHVTIGRIKNIENKKRFRELITKLQPINNQIFNINSWSLYQSKLHSDGVEYRILKTWQTIC